MALIGIAGAHQISVDSIAKLNHLNNSDKNYPGQKLQLTAAGTPVSHKRYVTVFLGYMVLYGSELSEHVQDPCG